MHDNTLSEQVCVNRLLNEILILCNMMSFCMKELLSLRTAGHLSCCLLGTIARFPKRGSCWSEARMKKKVRLNVYNGDRLRSGTTKMWGNRKPDQKLQQANRPAEEPSLFYDINQSFKACANILCS